MTINSDTKTYSGKNIKLVWNHFENINVSDGENIYFMSYSTLNTILSKFNFRLVHKRTRTWLEID